tara:strand:- start:40 stop:228 length:189 start_codon:yes stop_codon:yes gene_type:complete
MEYRKQVNRDNVKYTFKTGNKNQFLTFTKEGNIIEGDTYSRVWAWRNRDKYEEILQTINSDI